jgi:integration host factor subunit beta
MIKSELIEKLAVENPHLTRADVTKVIDAIFGEITDAVSRSGRVELRGFGAFQAKQHAARLGRNPRTGGAVHIDAKQIVAFKASKNLLARINDELHKSAGTLPEHRI